MVSLRRVEVYLNSAEVDLVPLLAQQRKTIAFESCTATWASASSSDTFRLVNVSLDFLAENSAYYAGKIGSGKTLTLMGAVFPFILSVCLRYNSYLIQRCSAK